LRLLCPEPADVFVWREALQGLEPAGEIVGGHEVGEMRTQLVVRLVEVALHRRLLDRAVHPLHLAVCPRMPRLCQPMVDVASGAGVFERVRPERLSLRHEVLDLRRAPSRAARIGEVRAVVGQHRMDLVGDRSGQVAKEVGGDARAGLFMQFDEGELRRPVDRHEQVEPALRGPHLGDVDVEIADRIVWK